MADTRGAATIVDRVEGWGHTAASDANREDNGTWGTDGGNTITATDATPEVIADRLARALAARKTFAEGDNPAIADRGLTAQQFADNEADYKTGVFFDKDGVAETGTGSNTEHATTDSEAASANRTATALPTSDLVGPDVYTIGSIVDRTSGWGHATGSQADRKDA